MKPAHSHSDDAQATFDVTLARIAIAFSALTILLPAIVAVLR